MWLRPITGIPSLSSSDVFWGKFQEPNWRFTHPNVEWIRLVQEHLCRPKNHWVRTACFLPVGSMYVYFTYIYHLHLKKGNKYGQQYHTRIPLYTGSPYQLFVTTSITIIIGFVDAVDAHLIWWIWIFDVWWCLIYNSRFAEFLNHQQYLTYWLLFRCT